VCGAFKLPQKYCKKSTGACMCVFVGGARCVDYPNYHRNIIERVQAVSIQLLLCAGIKSRCVRVRELQPVRAPHLLSKFWLCPQGKAKI
jgi:hypothetical protein